MKNSHPARGRIFFLASGLLLLVAGAFQNCGNFEAVSGAADGQSLAGGSDPVGSGDPANGSSPSPAPAANPAPGPYQIKNIWEPFNQVTAPAARWGHATTWTGNRMFIWSGYPGGSAAMLNEGALYNPATGLWSPISTAGAYYPANGARAVWTGSKVIVWGGLVPVPITEVSGNTTLTSNSSAGNTGAIYDPATDTWSPFEQMNPPSGRAFHAMVWTGDKLIVWGGYYVGLGGYQRGDGAIYDPATKAWRSISQTGAPSARQWVQAVWAKNKMFMFGGCLPYGNEFYSYDPATDQWARIQGQGAIPSPRCGNSIVWTGKEIVIMGGGMGAAEGFATAYAYDPDTNIWRELAPSPGGGRSEHSGVWTGESMLIWGGFLLNNGRPGLNTGAVFK